MGDLQIADFNGEREQVDFCRAVFQPSVCFALVTALWLLYVPAEGRRIAWHEGHYSTHLM